MPIALTGDILQNHTDFVAIAKANGDARKTANYHIRKFVKIGI